MNNYIKPYIPHTNFPCRFCCVYSKYSSNLPKNKRLLKNDNISPKPLLICSGGTSSRCAANDHWTLDLRKKFNFFDFNQNTNEVITIKI